MALGVLCHCEYITTVFVGAQYFSICYLLQSSAIITYIIYIYIYGILYITVSPHELCIIVFLEVVVIRRININYNISNIQGELINYNQNYYSKIITLLMK